MGNAFETDGEPTSVIVVGFWDDVPEGYTLINATSQGERELSPFFLGPCQLYIKDRALLSG